MATFQEMNLPVGARLQMTIKSGPSRGVHYTELIGYIDGDFLIVKIPVEHGHCVHVQHGDQLNFRIFSGVDIFTFSSIIQSIFAKPHNYMHISFPVDVQATALRGAIRAKVDLPVQVNGRFLPATITNISVSGAGITTEDKLGEPGDELLISFSCPVSLTRQNVPIKTPVKICNVQRLPNTHEDAPPKFTYGVMFHAIDPTNKVMLQNFVYEALNRRNMAHE